MPDATLKPSSSTRALLLKAFEAGLTAPLLWTEIDVGPLRVTVAADAMKAPLLDRPLVRLPVSYAETITICRALGCVAPTRAICDAMFEQARAQIDYVGLVATKADEARMRTVEFTLRFDDRVERRLAQHAVGRGDLVFGAWKLWLLHRNLTVRGAVNHGFWDLSKRPPAPIQVVGSRHDAAHWDYSQLIQPVQRMARRADDGAVVDLLDVFATENRIAQKFLQPYRQ